MPVSTLRYLSITAAAGTIIVLGVWILFPNRGGRERNVRARIAGDTRPATRAPGRPDTRVPDSAGRHEPEGPSLAAVAPDAEPPSVSHQIVEDDGHLLWASPTTGPPIQLRYVPQGAQLWFVTRPSDILAQPEGVRTLDALGPRFRRLRESWEQKAGVTMEEVEHLIVALIPQNELVPRVAWVVRLREPRDFSIFPGGSPVTALESGTIYRSGNWHYFVPAREQSRVFAMGTLDDMQDVAQRDGVPPSLRRQLDSLRKTSDANRHVTVLCAPNFLFGDGRKLFVGSCDKVRGLLEWLLGDGIQAAQLSMHFGDSLFLEARLYGTLDTTPLRRAAQLRDRIQQLPARLERYIGEVDLTHWQPLAIKFPGMVRFLTGQIRSGAEMDQTVVNAVLPRLAAHNLALASELAMEARAAPPSAAEHETRTTAQTMRDVLAHRLDIDVPQQSLEFALQDLVLQVRDTLPRLPFLFDVKILGSDLREEGITRNQQVKDFAGKDRTVEELLTGLVMKANPVTTVKAPSEQDQKLVWVVGPDPDDPDREVILVTTRRAARQKGYELPRAFRADGTQ